MKLDEEGYRGLLADLQRLGFTGGREDLHQSLQRQALKTHLRLLSAQMDSYYGPRHVEAKKFFARCISFVCARFARVHGEGPAFDEPYFSVSRWLPETQSDDESVRVVWMDMRIEGDADKLVVTVAFYGKQDRFLREREYRFAAEAKSLRLVQPPVSA